MAGLSRVGFAAAPSALRRLGSLGGRRAYGSAAAVEYNYYDDEDEERSHYSGPDAFSSPGSLAAAAGLTSDRGVQWVLIGDPGVKKHLYAEKLSKVLQVPHISMGTLLRQELNPSSALCKQIFSRVNEGKLVPEEVIFGLLSRRLEEGYSKGESGFILDGIPRTKLQAEIIDQLADIDLVVNFKSAEQGLVKSKYAAGVGHSPSATGAGRSYEEKFRVYAEEGKAVENHYRKQRKLLDFQAAGGPGGDTWQGLLAALHLKNANALLSSKEVAA